MEASSREGRNPPYSPIFLGHSFATFSNSTCTLTLHTTPELTLPLPPVSSLFSLPPRNAMPYECIYAITAGPTPSICHVHAVSRETPSLSLISQTALPLPSPATFTLPVDPMGWISSHDPAGMERDVLLSVDRDGQLMFWIPEGKTSGWRCTGKVRTGRRNIRMARCSSAKRTVLSALFLHPTSARRVYTFMQSCLAQTGKS
jgi:hypothetical protein